MPNAGSDARWSKSSARDAASARLRELWADPDYRQRQVASRRDPAKRLDRKLRAGRRYYQEHQAGSRYGERMTQQAKAVRLANQDFAAVLEALLVRGGWRIARLGASQIVTMIAAPRLKLAYVNDRLPDELGQGPQTVAERARLEAQGWRFEPFSRLVGDR